MNNFFVGVSKHRKQNIFAKIIEYFGQSPYSHIFIILEDQIYESNISGFKKTSYVDFIKDKQITDVVRVCPENFSFARGWLQGNIGKRYSFFQYIGFVNLIGDKWGTFRGIFRSLSKPFRLISRNNRASLICSEAVYRFMVECCGMEDSTQADFVTPKEVLNLVREHKHKKQKERYGAPNSN